MIENGLRWTNRNILYGQFKARIGWHLSARIQDRNCLYCQFCLNGVIVLHGVIARLAVLS
jgi:hypothetical protein